MGYMEIPIDTISKTYFSAPQEQMFKEQLQSAANDLMAVIDKENARVILSDEPSTPSA